MHNDVPQTAGYRAPEGRDLRNIPPRPLADNVKPAVTLDRVVDRQEVFIRRLQNYVIKSRSVADSLVGARPESCGTKGNAEAMPMGYLGAVIRTQDDIEGLLNALESELDRFDGTVV